MRILHLASEYPPGQVYGLGRFVHGLARAQAAQGDDVLVLTNSHGGAEDDVVRDGVRLHRIASPNPPRPPSGQGEVLQFNHGLVARVLERREDFAGVEVVCGHDWLTAPAARELAGELDAPLVVTVHDEVVGKRFGVPAGADAFVRQLEALTCHDASHVIANSRYVADQVVRRYGVEPARVSAIHGGIDPALLEVEDALVDEVRSELVSADERLVLYAGRLDAEKGLGVLADAALLLRDTCPHLRLAIAGTGVLEPALREALAPLGPRVQFLGYVSGPRLAALYRAADVVCVPSLYEPFGLVALEGMLAGTPVVASSCGGLAEIVRHEEDGLLVPPGDALALATAVSRLARDPETARALGQAAAARAREVFSWERIAAESRGAYAQALAERRPPCAAPPPTPLPPLVSVVIASRSLLGERAAAAAGALLAGTDHPALEVLVVGEGEGAELPLGRAPAGHERQARLLRLQGPWSLGRALNLGVEAARGEQVCLLGEDVRVLPEGRGWLSGLVWLLDDARAASAAPTLVGRVSEAAGAAALGAAAPALGWRSWAEGCVLVRRAAFAEHGPLPEDADDPVDAWAAALPGTHWTHPARLALEGAQSLEGQSLEGQSLELQPLDQEVLAPGAEPLASVVLVAHDGLADTRAAIAAVQAGTRVPYELVLVDNGSSDDTRAFFRALAAAPGGPRCARVQVIENEENLGYPRAANQGIAAARAPHVVLLNNDTEVRLGWLKALRAAARSAPRVGIVTAKILNPDGTVQNAGGILHHPDGSFTVPHAGEDRLAPTVSERRAVESASGPCMLLTRALLDEVGPFDEAYSPAYYEDSDLCFRARAAGFCLLYEPGAEVVHRAQSTSGRLVREGKLDLARCLRENQARFYGRWRRELIEDEGWRRLLAVADRLPRHRVLLCYGRSETTTAAYVEAALREAHEVVVAGPGQALDLGERASAAELCEAGGGGFDLLLCVEGENYFPARLADAPCPTALWAIDNHLHARDSDGWHLELARAFEHVFVAQRDHLPLFWERGVAARWLPLACDPAVHGRKDVEQDLDVVFVGHVRPFHRRRRRLLDRLAARFRVHEAQGVFRAPQAELFSRAKVVFNCSLAGDLNMRVFEGLAAGRLLLTDRIGNGLEQLFADGEHLVLYEDDTLEDLVARYLEDEPGREAIAARGARLALTHHTYRRRTDSILRRIRDAARAAAREERVA
ncbi:MAG: glycosyltransferase [Vicinamibacteria bacterium]